MLAFCLVLANDGSITPGQTDSMIIFHPMDSIPLVPLDLQFREAMAAVIISLLGDVKHEKK